MELSGSTTANWVAKTANLLVDGFGAPERVGLLLPLHWQAVCFLLGGVAAGATVDVVSAPEGLAGCTVAFVDAAHAGAALDAGVDDVLACSLTPFGTRLAEVPPMALDAAAEVPTYGDHFAGRPTTASVEVDGVALDVPALDLTAADRVVTTLAPAEPGGLAAALGVLRAGAALVLLRSGDLARTVTAEAATAVIDGAGLRRL